MGTLTLTVHYDNAEALAQALDYYADHIRYDREAGWPVIPGAVTISNAPGGHHGVLIQTLPSRAPTPAASAVMVAAIVALLVIVGGCFAGWWHA